MQKSFDTFTQGLQGRIAFVSLGDKDYEICVMQADGSSRKQLIAFPFNEIICFVAYSPNGEQIAFTSHRDGNYEIYIMKSNGSDLKRLTHTRSTTYGAAWSSDGKHIAFTSCLTGTEEIYVIDTDGSNQKQLTSTAFIEHGIPQAYNKSPTWSPDNRQIAFTSARSGNLELHIMNADGSDPQQLTELEGSKSFPEWSPDGKQIAFIGTQDLAVIDPSGANLRQLVKYDFLLSGPFSWSPDSKHITYSSHVDVDLKNRKLGHGEIFVVKVADGQSVRLTTTSTNNHYPSWISP